MLNGLTSMFRLRGKSRQLCGLVSIFGCLIVIVIFSSQQGKFSIIEFTDSKNEDTSKIRQGQNTDNWGTFL